MIFLIKNYFRKKRKAIVRHLTAAVTKEGHLAGSLRVTVLLGEALRKDRAGCMAGQPPASSEEGTGGAARVPWGQRPCLSEPVLCPSSGGSCHMTW